MAEQEWKYINSYEDNDLIFCPKCEKSHDLGSDDLDWSDGEERIIICECGEQYKVLINRPIIIDVFKSV